MYGRPILRRIELIGLVFRWVIFIITMLFLSTTAFETFARTIKLNRADAALPSATILVSLFVVLAMIQMTHRSAAKRRRSQLGEDAPPTAERGDIGAAQPEVPLPWLLQKRRHLWLVAIVALAGVAWVLFETQASQLECDAYNASNRLRPDQVIDCPRTD